MVTVEKKSLGELKKQEKGSLLSCKEWMVLAWECCQRVIIALQTDWHCIADVIDDLDAWAHFVQTETVTIQNLAITFRVQIGETIAEFERITIDNYLPKSGFSALQHLFR